jgi:uncharacterized delta-60 repeat protein
VRGSYRGGERATLTLTGSGSGACTSGPNSQRPLCISGGAFVAGTYSTTRFTSASAVDVQGTVYAHLQLQPGAAGTPTYQLGAGSSSLRVNGDLTIGNGVNPVTVSTTTYAPTVVTQRNLVVNAGAVLSGSGAGTFTTGGDTTGAGTISLSGGVYNQRPEDALSGIGSSSGAQGWSFSHLKATNGAPYGTNGRVTFNSGGTNVDKAWVTALAPDGSAYVGGESAGDFVVRKYTADGALDTGWGNTHVNCAGAVAGQVCYSLGVGTGADGVSEIGIGTDGSIYVVGFRDGADIIVRKYTPAGALDTTWGNTHVGCGSAVAGMVCYSSSNGAGFDQGRNIEVAADGSIYVAAVAETGWNNIVVLRYTPGGALDTGWGNSHYQCSGPTQGMFCYSGSGTGNDQPFALELGKDGSVYVGGTQQLADSTYDMIAFKLTPGGALDTGWGNTHVNCAGAVPGIVCYSSAGASVDAAHAMDLGPDEALYLGGYINPGAGDYDFVVRKYTPAGALDTGWGNTHVGCAGAVAGMVCYSSSAGGGTDMALDLAVGSGGELLVSGFNSLGVYDMIVRKYTSAGALDTGWGNVHDNCGGAVAGMVCYSSSLGAGDDQALGVELAADGSIIVAGHQQTNGYDWFLRKYTPPGRAASGAATVRAAAGGTGTITTTSELEVGLGSDGGGTTLDLETNDRIVDNDNHVTIRAAGTINASSSAAFTVGNDLSRWGTFTPNSGTVTFDTAGFVSVLDATGAGQTTFHNLTIATASKEVSFDHANQTNVTGALSVNGAACGTLAKLTSSSPGNRFELNASGTQSVSYARITDSAAITAATAATSETGGNNTGWTISTGACSTISVSVPTGATEALSALLLPGNDATAQSSIDVTTNNATGYSLGVTDTSNAWGLNRTPAGGTVDDWTGTSATPTTWAAATPGPNGYFGLTVLSADAGRLAKWGAGSTTESDFTNNLYLGLLTSSSVLQTTAAPATNDTTTVAYRAAAASGTPAGSYSSTITYTATANA